MGGVASDVDGRTSLDGLWAVGEVASTGVHGANRLASNSLLEALVFGWRAATAIDEAAARSGTDYLDDASSDDTVRPDAAAGPDLDRAALQRTMWEAAGVERSGDRLAAALEWLDTRSSAGDAISGVIEGSAAAVASGPRDGRFDLETANLRDVARLVLAAALAREESRGAHFRRSTSRRPTRPGPARRAGRERCTSMLTDDAITEVVRRALREDAPWGDVTSEALIPEAATAVASVVAREEGVLSGSRALLATAREVDPLIEVELRSADGERFAPGDTLAVLRGSARGILRAERIALNLLQRLSGIATLTARYVELTDGHPRPDRRHPQDDAGAPRARARRRDGRGRPQPPLLALRRRAREGQPPRDPRSPRA